MGNSRLAGLRREQIALLILLVLGLFFFLDHATLRLATDDVAWLQGEAPTVFDQYRQIPRLFFVTLHALVGPSAVAALAMIYGFHALNIWLVYRLGRELLQDGLAALVAAAVFAINPLTLSTLTWISCFSYVLGTTLALAALLACWEAGKFRAEGFGGTPRSGRWPPPGARSGFWSTVALLCLGLGLLCSHEIFFLPLVFLILSWLQGETGRGVVLCVAGMILALLANAYLYQFGRYGVEAKRLFSPDFALAYASSGLSSGLSLILAYPLSFAARTLDFLQLCFVEPVRWALTVMVLTVGLAGRQSDRDWRLHLALAGSFLALITPYIIRLYLTPDTVNYHISYTLSGRVFYLPFTVLSLVLGWSASWLLRPIGGRRWAWLILLLPLVAYSHALWFYERADFLGLSVAVAELPGPLPPRWNPYAEQHPSWFLVVVGIVALLMVVQVVWKKRARVRLSHPDSA